MSESKINMSLDDIIKKQKKPFKRGGNQNRGGRGGRNVGPFRGNRKFSNNSDRPLNKNLARNFNSNRGGRGRNTNITLRGRGGMRGKGALDNRNRLNNQMNSDTQQNKRVNIFLMKKAI